MVVIDADTSGSTVALTSWDSQRVKVAQICRTEQGISSFLDNGDAAGDALVKCIKNVTKLANVQMEGLSIYLAATGDMRALDRGNNEKVAHLYVILDKEFRAWNLNPIKLETMSERDELAFAWLTANFDSGAITSEGQKTVGVLELADNSERSAFEGNTTEGDNSTISVFAFDKEYKVRTFISLCTGLRQSEYRQVFFEIQQP